MSQVTLTTVTSMTNCDVITIVHRWLGYRDMSYVEEKFERK